MENKYIIILNADKITKKVYERNFKNENYDTIVNNENMLFAKKTENKETNLKYEKYLIDITISMIKKYQINKFIYMDLTNTINAIDRGYIIIDDETEDDTQEAKLNDVEKILEITKLYKRLKDNKEEYKKYADWYIDFELEEWQTYKDLYEQEKEKFIKLFKEMLEYLKERYKREDFDYLESLVMQKYPYYLDIFIHLDTVRWDTRETYISVLDSMERIYRKMSNHYKNHEQNMKEYEEEQKAFEQMEFDECDYEDEDN